MAKQRKMLRLSSVSSHTAEMDSVKASAQKEQRGMAKDALDRARQCWEALDSFRKERERCKRYVYGNQWGDVITDEYGRRITEEEYIRQQGNVPLKNNLIRRLVRTVAGTYRNQKIEPICIATDREEQDIGETMTIALHQNWRKNKLDKVLGSLFNEFLISGLVATKEVYMWRKGVADCFTMTPHPNYLFFDGKMSDYRLWDMTIIGEIHDLTFNELSKQFAHSPEDFQWLLSLYAPQGDKQALAAYSSDTLNIEGKRLANTDFLIPRNRSLYRVIEVWEKERKPRVRCHDYLSGDYYIDEVSNLATINAENAARIAEGVAQGIAEDDIPLITYEWFIDDYWYYRFLTPDGHILEEGESSYGHREHPYTIEIYPMVDGEAHSFVADGIDQQKYINRLITLNDWMVRSSTKGLTLFPESARPDNMTEEQLAAEIARPNGLIFYNDKAGHPAPTQLISPGRQAGLSELLNLQLSLMDDVTGVTGALQGKLSYSGVSGSLFAQQAQQASNSLVDILDSFGSFVRDMALKKVYLIQQTYTSKRVVSIAGNKGKLAEYDPNKMAQVEFDLNIVDSLQTPTYRSLMNEYLLEFFKSGAINIEQVLECGSFPFADRLLQTLRSQQEKLEQGQKPDAIPADLRAEIAAGADPAAMQALDNAIAGGFSSY